MRNKSDMDENSNEYDVTRRASVDCPVVSAVTIKHIHTDNE